MNIKPFNWGDTTEKYRHFVEQEIFVDKLYLKFFDVEPNDIVVDLGASVGPFTYSILPKQPKHVFCLEPSSDFFPTLIDNTLQHQVTPLNVAVAPEGKWDISVDMFGAYDTQKTVKVPAISLTELKKRYGIDQIDFIKKWIHKQ